jgi:hypothetical protein
MSQEVYSIIIKCGGSSVMSKSLRRRRNRQLSLVRDVSQYDKRILTVRRELEMGSSCG